MKRFIITVCLGLGFGLSASAKPAQVYDNAGPLTNAPQIDATIFINSSIFDLNTAVSLTNFSTTVANGFSSIPYSTDDTLYYTNLISGVMSGTPGFVFDTVTSASRHSAINFVNHGTVAGVDLEAFPTVLITTAGTTAIVAQSQPIASQIQVLATNILNDGTMEVGNYGLLSMIGSNINNANGVLVAGGLDTSDPIDTTGGGDLLVELGGQYYVNPPGVYDLYWGVTNGGTLDVTALTPPQVPGVNYTTRPGITGGDLPLILEEFDTNHFATYVDGYFVNDPTNIYYNIVFVYTNFTDLNGQPNTNITATVGFNGGFSSGTNVTSDPNADMAMVQFALATTDATTGATATNAVYLLDNGFSLGTFVDEDNAGSADGYKRANAFTVTTTTPLFSWPGFPGNFPYSGVVFYQANNFVNKKVTFEAAEYGAQIGRNPGELDGAFNFPLTAAFQTHYGTNTFTNFFTVTGGLEGVVTLPDPTNEPARIELTGKTLNLSNTRIRAEGMVTINSSNIVGHSSGYDFGEMNAQIGAVGGSLVLSNFFPTNFQRLRGDIYAWSGTWQNSSTNGVTNNYHYHLLIVGQNLGGNFPTAIRNLSLSATNSVTVQDSLNIINSVNFNTSNLNLNANATLTGNAENFTTAGNAPKLKNFFVNTNASFEAQGLMDFGYDLTKLPIAPAKRKYTINSITNLGTMSATEPLFQIQNFENDGTVLATNNGSITVDAASIGLGLVLTNATTNFLVADESVTLSAISMGFTNSEIIAGGTNITGQGQLILDTTSSGQITDFASGSPSTNTYVTNQWQATGGFSLAVKPATGDLYGTEITTIATNFTMAVHTWAGVDWGNSLQGWTDNMVIGHLKLSRQSPGAQLHFTGATSTGKYGMYVDYLELDQNSLSYTNYRDGLVIDSNLTIYFAAANVDPIKLESAYTNRLVWVPTFWGPNSTVSVPYTNCAGATQYCLMNANLASSPVIGFFTNTITGNVIPNAFNQPFVLNDPNGDCTDIATNFTSCGGDMTMFKDFTILTAANTAVNVDISTVGSGTITPNLTQRQVAMGRKIALTATPSKGWEFAGWTASGLTGDVNIKSRVIRFTVQNNLMLTATFVPKAFTLVQGAYYGLFVPSNSPPTPATSGWFTMTVAADGACSGRFLMGANAYSFTSKFTTNGVASVVAKHGSQSVTASLQLDMTGQSGQVTGYVGTPSVRLLGNLAPVWTRKNSSPYAGQFTMVLTNGGSNSIPIGDSYGVLTVSKLGILSVAGQLADGNAFSQSVPISQDGFWPFYAYVNKGSDFLLGWVSFESNPVNGPSINPTNIFWYKAGSSKTHPYSAGFAHFFNLAGSLYVNPGRGAPVLTLVNPVVELSGDGLASSLVLPVVAKNNIQYSGTNLTLNINPAAGTFSGRLQNDKGEPPIKWNGVILQNQDSGFGFFLGTNEESGAVLFQSQ